MREGGGLSIGDLPGFREVWEVILTVIHRYSSLFLTKTRLNPPKPALNQEGIP